MKPGWSPSSRICSDAPNHTKNNGAKKPSVMPNNWRASLRGGPTAATTSPRAKPDSMIDTWVVVASAQSANNISRLNRNSSANLVLLRIAMQPFAPTAAVPGPQHQEQNQSARRDSQCAERRAHRAGWVDHQRQQND